jgi:hypothetical protein
MLELRIEETHYLRYKTKQWEDALKVREDDEIIEHTIVYARET